MSSEIIEPSAGLPHSDEPPAALPGGVAHPVDSRSGLPPVAPRPAPEGTSSFDELVLALGQVSPDPFLEEFKPEPAPEAAAGAGGPEPRATPIGTGDLGNIDLDVPPSAEKTAPPAGRAGAASSGAPRPGPAASAAPQPSTSERFAALDLNSPPASQRAAVAAKKTMAAKHAEPTGLDDDEVDYAPAHGSSWLIVLLGSYASAVTLGLIWVLWGHRAPRESATVEPDPFPVAETTADPGHRAGQSHKVVVQDALSAERIIAPGETIVIGSLEVTPLEIAAGPVILRREVTEVEARRGGNDALILKLRLKNLSNDSTLVPLDEAFIRERKRGIRDSYIEAGQSQQIDMYPLAIVSEWSIAGQDFRELQPGESYETRVVSVPDALDRLTPEMTWQLRLRTDLNQTGRMGIRFHKDDIRRMSPEEVPSVTEPGEPAAPGDDSTGSPANP
jgi:hypothetical protein